jgi:hypothetical protein
MREIPAQGWVDAQRSSTSAADCATDITLPERRGQGLVTLPFPDEDFDAFNRKHTGQADVLDPQAVSSLKNGHDRLGGHGSETVLRHIGQTQAYPDHPKYHMALEDLRPALDTDKSGALPADSPLLAYRFQMSLKGNGLLLHQGLD